MPGAAGSTPVAHKGGGGILGAIGHAIGNTYHNVADLPISVGKGIVHLGGDVAQLAGVSPTQIANQALNVVGKGDRSKLYGTGVQALTGTPTGDKGLHVIAQQTPTLYQAGKHLEQTAQGVPDIVANAAEDTTGHGPGLANSIYGRRIHNEGVLGAGLSTAGDVAMLAGGVGMAGKAAGFGNLAKASEAEGLAAKAVGNAAKGDAAAESAGAIKTSEAAKAAAQAARDAGNVSKAAEYESAASNLEKAEAARTAAAGRGTLGRAAENATAGAKTVAHFGNQVANAPAEIYTKAIPKLVNLIPGVDTAAAAAKIAETVGKIPVVQTAKEHLAAGAKMKDLMARSRGEEQRLLNPMNSATAQINRILPEHDEQVAAYLSRTGDAATTLRPLAGLPDAEIQSVIDSNQYLAKEGVTPAAVKMAVAHVDGTLPAETAARFDQAHSLMEDSIYGPKAERHVTGYGDKAPMNPIKQAGREANVAGEPSQMAVGQLQDRMAAPVQKLLNYHQAKLDEALQQGLSERNVPLSPTQEKQAAARGGAAKATTRLGSERQGITATAKAEEATTRAQDIANRRSLADANREIAARSGRVNELQARLDQIPEEASAHPSVQAPQVQSLLSHASAVAESLRARAGELEQAGPENASLAAQLRAAADAQPKLPADVAGQAQYIRGGETPGETAQAGRSSGPRMKSRVKTGNETARETDWAPLTANGQQALLAQDIAKIPRNELPRMVQHEVGDTAGNVATEPGLTGSALAAHLAETKAPDGGHWVAWRPEGSGGVLDPDLVTPDSAVISSRILDQYQKWNPTKSPSTLGKIANAINDARLIKLLGTGFVQHKALADMGLNQAVAGVGPAQSIKGALAAHRQIKEGVLPPDIGIMQGPKIEPGEGVAGKAKNVVPQIKAKGMGLFRSLDTHNRVGLYNTLTERGMSPQTASEVVKMAAGDLQGMSPATKAAGRAVFTYAPWQLHLAQVAKNLLAAHPAGVAEGASIRAADQAAHPGQVTKPGELADFANPFGSFIGTPTPKPGQSMGDAVLQRAQQSINPLLELGAGALTGLNLRKGEQVTTPGHPFGAQGATGPLLGQPGNLLGFGLHTLVPQVGQVQDALGRSQGPGGYIPFRQDTGQPENKKGQVQSQPDTTRADALARLLGYPHAEKAPAPKKAKRGRG